MESQDSALSLEQRLLKLNVNDHVEKKQNLSYLSWAWAWAEALKADPSATYHVHTYVDAKNETVPFMNIGATAMVWVDVTMGGRTRTCWLPVMDYRNKAIENPDAFQVNTAIMRCLTKCLGMFGLGLYIYAGEDLPEAPEAKKPEPKGEVPKQEENASKGDSEGLATLQLFAEGILKFVDIATDEAGLRAYWKANQSQLEALKQRIPDEYSRVLARFKEAQAAFRSLTSE